MAQEKEPLDSLPHAPTFHTCPSGAPPKGAFVYGVALSVAALWVFSSTLTGRGVHRTSFGSLSVDYRHFWASARTLLSPPLFLASALLAQKPVQASEDVIDTLMSQFDRSDIVALGEWHGSQADQDLRIQLIRHRDFPKKVRNIVVECGNSLYQEVLDRYIRGEDVPNQEMQRVWRDTTQSPVGVGDSPACAQFLSEVRSLNRGLPVGRMIRVLAGDPPIDWAKVTTAEAFTTFLGRRDQFPAGLIAQEVLRKGQKALVIYGAGHIWRKNQLVKEPNLAALMDKDFPGRLYTVIRIGGIFSETEKLEGLIKISTRPVLLPLKGTAFGALDANRFIGRDVPVRLFPEGIGMGEVADACIYSGRSPDRAIGPDPSADADPDYVAEKERRRRLMPGRKK